MASVVDNLFSIAVFAWAGDDLSFAATLRARRLRSGVHAREDLLASRFDPGPVAGRTGLNISIGISASSTTVVTKDLLLDHEFDIVARIDVGEADFKLGNHGRTAAD